MLDLLRRLEKFDGGANNAKWHSVKKASVGGCIMV